MHQKKEKRPLIAGYLVAFIDVTATLHFGVGVSCRLKDVVSSLTLHGITVPDGA